MKIAVLPAALAVLTLSGCGGTPITEDTHPSRGWKASARCTGPGTCNVDVKVIRLGLPPGADCLPVIHGDVTVTAPMHIHWHLGDNRYSFKPPGDAKPGIFIVEPLDGEFDPVVTGNKNKFTLFDKHSKGKPGDKIPYKYGVWVYDEASQKFCLLLDPVVVNEY